MKKLFVLIYRWVIILTALLLVGIVCQVLVLISLGGFRNFCIRYIFKYVSRFLLIISGYTYDFPAMDELPDYQVLFIINHNSYLDPFILASFGIPNTQYMLSEKTMKYIPLFIAAKAIGTRYIPQKKYTKRRLRFFIKTTRFLKQSKFSIIASAEGVHKHSHTIHPFNKGVFHMALEAGIPIQPLFIHIPEKANPFQGGFSKAGHIKLYILDKIDNSNWKFENIRAEITNVRQVYVQTFNALNNRKIT